MFTDNSIQGVKSYFHEKLSNAYPAREIDNFFSWFLEDEFQLSSADLILGSRRFSESELLTIRSVVKRLQTHEPYQYIMGRANFLGLDFFVKKGVLIPRPETEELVQLVLSDGIEGKVLDIGCGSGVIPITLKLKQPALNVVGLDVSDIALEVTELNAKRLKASITTLKKDILKDTLNDHFDVIVSNPPYVLESDKLQMHPNVLENEPDLALFVDDAEPLLFYKRIVRLCQESLKPSGHLYFEIHEAFGNELKDFVRNNGFSDVQVIQDLQGKDRILRAIKKPQ